MQPEDLHCDEQTFQNYAGVEEQEITDAELTAHLAKGHIMAFNTYQELCDFVGSANPILNKLGLIVKTRNGITKARMILDTKQSGVKLITSQGQRVTLPRLFDAILQLLFLQAVMTTDADSESVTAFVLDFSDAFWQIPISPAEQTKNLCQRAHRRSTEVDLIPTRTSGQRGWPNPLGATRRTDHASHAIAG